MAKILSNLAVQALNHLCSGGLIGMDDFPVVFGVELAAKCLGANRITEQDDEWWRSPSLAQIAPHFPRVRLGMVYPSVEIRTHTESLRKLPCGEWARA
jgi:hypothetical protein